MWCYWEWTWGKTGEVGEQIGDIIGSLEGILGTKQPTKIQTPPSPKEEIRSSWMHVELSHLLSEISIPKFAWFQPRLVLLRKSLGLYPCFHSIQWHELDIVTYIFISTFFFKVYSSIMVLRKVVCFFCFVMLRSSKPQHPLLQSYYRKVVNERGALRCSHNVLT